jgi:hypothetical protein
VTRKPATSPSGSAEEGTLLIAILVRVNQRFLVKQRRGDRDGFSFVAPDLGTAKKELGEWIAADIAIVGDGSTSFAGAIFYDQDAFRRDPRHCRPLATMEPVANANGHPIERMVTSGQLCSEEDH